MRKLFLRIGSITALLSVALGAFGAHALKTMISAEHLQNFETGVRYQFYHSLAILIVGVLHYFGKKKLLDYSGWSFFAGIILFSGSLYLLAFRDIFALPVHIIGPLTPIGGVLFIGGWSVLFLSTFQHHQRRPGKGN